MVSARLRLVECRKVLGGEYDPLRAVWDDYATLKDRRLLLAVAVANAWRRRRGACLFLNKDDMMRYIVLFLRGLDVRISH